MFRGTPSPLTVLNASQGQKNEQNEPKNEGAGCTDTPPPPQVESSTKKKMNSEEESDISRPRTRAPFGAGTCHRLTAEVAPLRDAGDGRRQLLAVGPPKGDLRDTGDKLESKEVISGGKDTPSEKNSMHQNGRLFWYSYPHLRGGKK